MNGNKVKFFFTGDGELEDYDYQVDGGQNRLDVQFIPTTLVVTSTVFIHPTASHTFVAGHPSSVPPSHFVPDDSGRLDHFTVFCKIYFDNSNFI